MAPLHVYRLQLSGEYYSTYLSIRKIKETKSLKPTQKMAEESSVKLHGMWASPFVLRVKLGLQIKGIKYDYIEEDLDNKSELLLQYNPVYKKVPVLVHNGRPISESSIILEYIDEAWPGPPYLLPKDPYERAKHRFWANYFQQVKLSLLFLLHYMCGAKMVTNI